MAVGSPGVARSRQDKQYSGTGPYPNNIDAMRKATNTLYRDVANSVGMSGGGYMKLVRGERVLTDAIAARIAKVFRCKIEDLRWKAEPRELVPYEAPKPPAKVGRPRKVPALQAQPAPAAREPIEITVARGGQLLGGITMFHPRDLKAVLRDIFGDGQGDD